MKKLSLIFSLVMISLIFSASYCRSENDVTTARIDVAKKTIGFAAGFASGFIFHEAGHAVVAKVENVGMDWYPSGHWTAYTEDSAKLRNIAIAGFGAQVLSTEVMLGVDAIPKDNAYVLGWLVFNIFNAVYYTTADSLQKGGCGDFETLRNNGTNTDLVKIGLLAHAALSAYRIYKNPKFIPYVEFSKNELVLGLTWRWN